MNRKRKPLTLACGALACAAAAAQARQAAAEVSRLAFSGKDEAAASLFRRSPAGGG